MFKQDNQIFDDRFIPKRANHNFDLSCYKPAKYILNNTHLCATNKPKFVNFAQINFNQHEYAKCLSATMLPTTAKVLNITENRKKKSKDTKCKVAENKLWPRTARKKPLIGPPLIILDMPDLDVSKIYDHIVDWSVRGCLATIYEQEVYLWHPADGTPQLLTYLNRTVARCLKWNKSGSRLAASMNDGSIAIWDFSSNKVKFKIKCCCLKKCVITAMDWTKTGKLITGCKRGRLAVWNKQSELTDTVFPAHTGVIINTTLSTDEHCLATTGCDKNVRCWSWPSLQLRFEITYSSLIRAISWHPWTDMLLCIGERDTGTLRLWDTNECKEISHMKKKDVCIDCLTWNKLTGELVVSYWKNSICNSEKANQILIYSSFETVVDAIEWHDGNVPYLLWGMGHTQLATSSSDENLCIWDFFGGRTKNKFPLNCINTQMLTTGASETRSIFRTCIR